MSIPVLEIDLSSAGGIWGDVLRPHRGAARALLRAFNRQAEESLRLVSGLRVAGPLWSAVKAASRTLHVALGKHYGTELAEMAEVLDVPVSDLLVGNSAYDISQASGCSAFAVPTAEGPLHARNLEWDLGRNQLLQKHVVVVRARNAPAGNYASVTWPGLFGVLTGLAPGRFSVSVNYVAHGIDSSIPHIIKRAALGYWPVTWVVRQVLDEAEDFAAAVRLLKCIPLLSPVLFTVAGVRNDERVVIERGVDTFAIRKPGTARAPVVTTNHYVSSKLSPHNVDLDEMDTLERMEALDRGLEAARPAEAAACLRQLSSARVLRSDIQHQVVMRPRDGLLVVRVPGRRATRIAMR